MRYELPVGNLNVKYASEIDGTIKFEEASHQYEVDWGEGFTTSRIVSVSKVYKQYFGEFDPDATLATMRARPTWSKSKYFGMTNEAIKGQWVVLGDRARDEGTQHHLLCERYYTHSEIIRPYSRAFGQFLQFAVDNQHRTPFRTEWRLRTNEALSVCGTPDMVYFSDTPGPEVDTLYLSIFDWKLIKKLSKFGFGKTGSGPLAGLPDSNYFHYAIQLNMYRHMLEHFYRDIVIDGKKYSRIHVDKLVVVVMHSTKRKYEQVELPDYRARAAQIFDLHALAQSRQI